MKNKQTTIILSAALALCGAFARAQESAVSTAAASVKPAMRIVQHDGMDVIVNFWSETLQNSRNVRILLPEGYGQTNTKYPAIYMMDGQNLFSRDTSFLGVQWGAADTARKLMSSQKTKPFIIVAVDNSPERTAEYTFDKNQAGEGGKAARFADFLCKELVPYIDTNYKASNNPADRFIGGAGLGGNLALYLLATRPASFSGAAVMSPDMQWNGDSLKGLAASSKFDRNARLWLDIGMLEGADTEGTMVLSGPTRTIELYFALMGNGFRFGDNFLFRLDPKGAANEASWGARFRNPLLFFFGATPEDRPADTPKVSSAKIGLNGVPKGVLLWDSLLYANGLEADFVPESAKASPPYLYFENGFFSFIQGAAKGKVLLYGKRGKHTFSRAVELVKEQKKDARLRINLTVPKDTPKNAKVYISGAGNAFGNWEAGKLQLAQDAKNKNLWHFSAMVRRGTPAVFKFTLGTWATVERDEAGLDVPDRSYKLDTENNALDLAVKRWTPPQPMGK